MSPMQQKSISLHRMNSIHRELAELCHLVSRGLPYSQAEEALKKILEKYFRICEYDFDDGTDDTALDFGF